MRWATGAATIEALLEAGELQRVPADRAIANRLLASARSHLESARTIRETDSAGSCQMSYDAARKACAGLLEAQGLRATSHGGHIAVRDAMLGQFARHAGGQVLRNLDRIRRRRNDLEYPDSHEEVGIEEVDVTLQRAEGIVAFAEQVVDHLSAF